MKKLVALAMSLTMAFSLVACGNSDASANAGTDTTATSAAATTTEAAQQTAPAEKQDVTLRMWGAEEDQPMLQGMIDSFKAPRDIDQRIRELGRLLGYGITLALQPSLTAADVTALLG